MHSSSSALRKISAPNSRLNPADSYQATAADRAFLADYVKVSSLVTNSLLQRSDEILALVEVLYRVAKRGGRIYTFGNGGSACDAMHLAEELVARYLRERPGIRAQHLIDSGTMTCWANDYEFETVFKRQVETLATADDAVIGFTTSGNSRNVLLAIEAGNELGAETIVFCGKDGGAAKKLAKHCFVVSCEETSHIQVAHMVMIHLVCDLLEQWLYPECTSVAKPVK